MKQAEMTGAHTWWQFPEGLAFVEAERLKALQLTEPYWSVGETQDARFLEMPSPKRHGHQRGNVWLQPIALADQAQIPRLLCL